MSKANFTTLRDKDSGDETPVLDAIHGSAKAWVNFNGTGTVAIRASYNVDSITDNGVGDYSVNFTNAMPDANYCVQTSTGSSGASGPGSGLNSSVTPPATTSVRVMSFNDVANKVDQDIYSVAIFR